MQLSIPAESAKSNIKFATLMAFPHGAACRAARAAIGFHGCQVSWNLTGKIAGFLSCRFVKSSPETTGKAVFHKKKMMRRLYLSAFLGLSQYFGGFTYFLINTPNLGEMIQFEEH